DGKLNQGGSRNALAGSRRLIDDCAVRPLRSGDVVDLAAKAGNVETVLRIDLGEAGKMRHDESGLFASLRDKYIDLGRGGSTAGAWRLYNHGIDGLIGHANRRDLSHLQSGAQKLDSRGAQRIAFEQWDL